MTRRGFTLLEILCAAVLLGVLTTFSILTFHSVSHGWQISADYLDKMQRTDYALDQVMSGLRSMYYPHDGSQNAKYGFVLVNRGNGEDPRRSDIIEWSKLGSALVGTTSDTGDSVHRVQVMVLEEGNDDYAQPIQKTGLYARMMRDSALGDDKDDDNTDLTFGNYDLYQPVLISDGVCGFNCRVLKKAEDAEASGANRNKNDRREFEEEFSESNSVPYKVELTFQIEKPDETFRSQTRRAPMVRIVRLPIHEQSLDGEAPPGLAKDKGKKKK